MKKIITSLSILLSSVALAQTPCDSLTIDVKYHPFSDSLIEVHVVNSSTGWYFNYPQFTLFDANNDTVAHEQMNFFGISQQQTHALAVHPGMPASNTFPGTLELYYITVDSYAICNWPMNFDLCPDTCTTFYPHLDNIGGQQVLGTANWEILNTSQQVVANGSFVLDVNNQSAADTICLNPGNYTYKVTNVNMTTGGQKYTGVWTENMYVQGPQIAFNDTVETIALEIFEACQQTTAVTEAVRNSETVKIWAHEGDIYLQHTAIGALGNIEVYSIDGKCLLKADLKNPTAQLDMSAYPTGLYIVKAMNTVKKVVTGN